jgi:hypothetical protein
MLALITYRKSQYPFLSVFLGNVVLDTVQHGFDQSGYRLALGPISSSMEI